MGRPSSFTEELADRICDELAEGRSLRSVCCDQDMPSQSSVFRWLADPVCAAFREQYARAREAQADVLFDEALDIADDGSNDWMDRTRADGSTEEVLNHEHIQRSKLRVDTRKWMASKLNARVYGDKLDLTSGNEPLRKMSDDDLDARIAAKLKVLDAR